MARNDGSIIIENARILFRNFAGKEGQYNREGDRNFSVLLDPEIARQLERDGWNVKYLKVREEDEGAEPQAYIQVSVKFDGPFPPRVVMITSRGRTNLGEDEVELLDWADIQNVDLSIRPYEWTVRDASGIKAYLKSIFVTIEEDELDRKYSDIEDIPATGGRVRE